MRPAEDDVPPFDLAGLRTCDLEARPSKVFVADLGKPLGPGATALDFLDSLPRQLAAESLRRLVRHLVRVKQDSKLAIAAIGGHVIKTGCGPYLIDWMRRGVLGGIAMNGAAAIHDLELAVAGRTSEDVGPRLVAGEFGMARQTADLYAHAARLAVDSGIGLGRALGGHLSRLDCRHAESSVLVQAYRLGIPCTVHVAMGTDVVHMHPVMDGAALGAATLHDFRVLTTMVSRMADGLWLNLGCAVIMPEVFLKAVSIVRNFGHSLEGLVSANLDMIQQYRGRVNVCERPSEEGIAITGHHEILIPLVHAATAAALAAACPDITAAAA
ncbi:MAG TPA: hypothetical protein VNC50_19820 [Planctomycetia bacterium]|nr:hypothetical protein [Planctomycetia bacterium]